MVNCYWSFCIIQYFYLDNWSVELCPKIYNGWKIVRISKGYLQILFYNISDIFNFCFNFLGPLLLLYSCLSTKFQLYGTLANFYGWTGDWMHVESWGREKVIFQFYHLTVYAACLFKLNQSSSLGSLWLYLLYLWELDH